MGGLRGALVAAIVLAAGAAEAETAYPPVDVLLKTEETVIGQPIAYPPGTAEVTAVIVTMQPGATTGWHRHDVPMFAYVLEGEVTVDYGPHGTRTYRAGEALVEALETPHDGTATASGPTRILAVFIGAEGAANTTMTGKPAAAEQGAGGGEPRGGAPVGPPAGD